MEHKVTLTIIRIILAVVISFALPVSHILVNPDSGGPHGASGAGAILFFFRSSLAALIFLLIGYSLRFLFRNRLSPLFVDLVLFLLIFGVLADVGIKAQTSDSFPYVDPFLGYIYDIWDYWFNGVLVII